MGGSRFLCRNLQHVVLKKGQGRTLIQMKDLRPLQPHFFRSNPTQNGTQEKHGTGISNSIKSNNWIIHFVFFSQPFFSQIQKLVERKHSVFLSFWIKNTLSLFSFEPFPFHLKQP